ncbi:DNA repair and recombination protein RadB [Candidatus Woesearchaeota archaeon]|nr:DNA repair and recombination protein RadB [Candidatus Woesearchaeota archaeon]
MDSRIPTGCGVLDKLLSGGLDADCITTIYGPAGSGKTNLALIAAVTATLRGKKVIYMDTEGGFSVERLKQLCKDHAHVLENVLFLRPTTFQEQVEAFTRLRSLVTAKIGLIVVDSISMLYRLELGSSEEAYDVNRALGKQLAALTEIARKKSIPVILTNQVYSSFDEREKVNMVGGDLLRYGSKCLVELQITPSNKRRAILRKHRSLAPDIETVFQIVGTGIVEAKESRGFNLFRKE